MNNSASTARIGFPKNQYQNMPSVQVCNYLDAGIVKQVLIPPPEQCVVEKVKWGEYDRVFTPAYWKVQTLMSDTLNQKINYKCGDSLAEEIAACVLGGYGITAETGFAAFQALKKNGLLSKDVALDHDLRSNIYTILSAGFLLNNKKIRYRFAYQRAERLSYSLRKINTESIPRTDIAFRDWLLTFNGIGPKTASWITRNWFDSDNVAIIDIHIFRACTIMGLFTGKERVDKDYFKLEKLFLQLTRAMNVCASKIDVIIWSQMKALSEYGLEKFKKISICNCAI